MTSQHEIDYEALAQDAMRGVVRAVLARVQKTGLPGEHHFYIAFNTRFPGVIISKRLKEKYADEMTIVLQHRFWDLIVTDERFEVKLTFDGIPERLAVPFAAVKVFFDPSVPYGLQFDESELAAQPARRVGRPADEGDVRTWSGPGGRPGAASGQAEGRVPTEARAEKRAKPAKRARPEKDTAPSAEAGAEVSDTGGEAPAKPALSDAQASEGGVAAAPAPGNVVSLDRFRKKP